MPDERALAARDAATQAFLALDDEQRGTATDVDAADELGTGRRLGEAWAQIALLGDQATTAYLAATTDTPPGRGTRTAGTCSVPCASRTEALIPPPPQSTASVRGR